MTSSGSSHSFFHFLKNERIIWFVVRFFLIFGAIELALIFVPIHGYQEWLARSLGSFFGLTASGIFVPVSSGSFEITPFCTGFTSVALFVGLLYGFSLLPSSKNNNATQSGVKKISYLVVGTLFLLAVNYIRLIIVIATGLNFSLAAADWAHTLSWFFLSAIAFGMWLLILRRESGISNIQTLGQKLVRE